MVPDKILIRPAELNDGIAAMAVLHRSITQLCRLDHADDPFKLSSWLFNKTPESWVTWVKKTELVLLVATCGDCIAGVGAMSQFGFIMLNYVDPDFQYRGVSKAMLEALEDRAQDLGLSCCRLNSTETAEHFYRGRGYLPTQCGTTGPLQFEKRLGPVATKP